MGEEIDSWWNCGGGAGEGRGGTRDENGCSGSTKTNDGEGDQDEDEDDDSNPGLTVRLYKGAPFCTGLWLEPVIKGL